MTEADYQDLALRVAEGTASAEERARFEQAMTNKPQRREEWLHLRAELRRLHEGLGDAHDLEGPAVELPAAVRARLQRGEAGPGASATRRWWVPAGLAAAVALALLVWRFDATPNGPAAATGPLVGYLLPTNGAVTLRTPTGESTLTTPNPVRVNERLESGTATLLRLDGQMVTVRPGEVMPAAGAAGAARWLAVPLAQLGGATRGGATWRLLAPRGATVSSEPLIAWDGPAAEKCEVRLICLTNPEEPAGSAKPVTSPLAFARLGRRALRAGEIYEVSVRSLERDLMLGHARFVVMDGGSETPGEADDPAALVRQAVAALQAEPARRGDAWLLWQRLPAAWRESELGRRLEAETRAP
ncbi:MAG: hypothetical protein QG602_1481 [Verrucomicrobiota bacterium]|nr:hypothetical protein [Verrucomicrobiota bacterium]